MTVAVNIFLGVLLLGVLVFLIRHFGRLKRQKLVARLKLAWGKPKEDEHFDFHFINRYYANTEPKTNEFHTLSDKTEADLDLQSLFKFIDRTISKIGQQFLYWKMRVIGPQEDLAKFEKLTHVFQSNDTLRLKSQVYLSKLSHANSYDLEELINGLQLKKPKIIWLVYALSACNIALFVVGFFNPIFFTLMIPIILANFVFHLLNKANVQYYMSGINELSKGLSVAKKLAAEKEIQAHFSNFNFIPSINAIRFRTKFIGIEKKLDSEIGFLVTYLSDLFKITFNLEYILFYSFIDSIIVKREDIRALFEFIGEIDAAIAIASVKSSGLPICMPQFDDKKVVRAEGLIHPLIAGCVPNDIHLVEKSMLLTGSNMSGKTTYIRTVALNSILAQTFNFCFATHYQAPFFKLYSSIRIADDVLESKSYYLEEVLTVKTLIDAVQNETHTLFILDEIFKGTNTIERISGGKAILSYLNNERAVVLVSTHDIELTELLAESNYDLYHFSETLDNDQLHFDHKLKPGQLTKRNAIQILELYNYPEEIIKDAREVEKRFGNSR